MPDSALNKKGSNSAPFFMLHKSKPLALATAITGFWLLARGYEGMRHDSVLYFGQAALHSGFFQLSSDPFFAGGSQDSLSLYSSIISHIYSVLGVAWANQFLLLASFAATASALILLLTRLGTGKAKSWGLLVVAVCSSIYGGQRVFGFTEAFLTARSLAEPLIIFSLVALAIKRLPLAAGLQTMAALIHPLMALPGMLMTWLIAVHEDRRWLWLLAGLPLAIGCAWIGIAPFDRLLQSYDSQWWTLIVQSNKQTVFSNWTSADWQVAVADTVVLFYARSLYSVESNAFRLISALLLSSAILISINVVATDVLHSVLITQLQLWRVLWLVHLMALALAPFIVQQWWLRGGLWKLCAGLLVAAMVNGHAAGNYGAPVIAGLLVTAWAARRGLVVSNKVLNVGVATTVLIALLLNASDLLLELNRLHWHPQASEAVASASLILTAPLVALVAYSAICWAATRSPAWNACALIVGIAFAAFSLSTWDRRVELSRQIESPPASRPFADIIPPDATVYWHDQLAAVWGLLHRVSFYLPQQGAGMLFNRHTAEIIRPRRDALKPITQDREACETAAILSGSPGQLSMCSTPSVARLQVLCRDLLKPDFLIFETPLPVKALAVLEITEKRYHLYSCQQFASLPS